MIFEFVSIVVVIFIIITAILVWVFPDESLHEIPENRLLDTTSTQKEIEDLVIVQTLHDHSKI